MNHDASNTSISAPVEGSERPTYEPPVVIDCGSVAALTLGGGAQAMSDSFGASGAGASWGGS